MPSRGVILEDPAELVAIQDRHDAVRHDHVRRLGGERQESFRSIASFHHVMSALMEQGLEQIQLGEAIVRDESR